MPSKENVLEVYKTEAEKYNKTRDIQWKMNFAVWTLLILAIVAKAKQEFNLSHTLTGGLEMIILIVFITLYFWFIWRMQQSLNNSLRRMRYMVKYTFEKEESIPLKWESATSKNNLSDKEKKTEMIGTWTWIIFELSITSSLLLILYFTNDTIIFG